MARAHSSQMRLLEHTSGSILGTHMGSSVQSAQISPQWLPLGETGYTLILGNQAQIGQLWTDRVAQRSSLEGI